MFHLCPSSCKKSRHQMTIITTIKDMLQSIFLLNTQCTLLLVNFRQTQLNFAIRFFSRLMRWTNMISMYPEFTTYKLFLLCWLIFIPSIHIISSTMIAKRVVAKLYSVTIAEEDIVRSYKFGTVLKQKEIGGCRFPPLKFDVL